MTFTFFISLYKYLKQALLGPVRVLVIIPAHRVTSPAYSIFALKLDWWAGEHFIQPFLRVKTQEGFFLAFSVAVSESSQTRTNWNAFIYLMTDRALTMLYISSFLMLCLIKCCLFSFLPHYICTGDKSADRVKEFTPQ